MKNFEYAQPRTEAEAVALLGDATKRTVVLAGGTDLLGLIKRSVIHPDRLVNICEIDSLRHIQTDQEGNLWIGAAVHLDELLDNKRTEAFPSIHQIVHGISSIQLQSQGTLVGEILRRPCCWYFRGGHGLLANEGRMIVDGDNRYHAILGNRGYAKFVNASRMAPALISLGAKVRVVGPDELAEAFLDLGELFRVPQSDEELEHVLKPGQMVTHVILPPSRGRLAAAYEVRHGEGPDQPLAAAAVALHVADAKVREATVVLGQVAPVPWVSHDAAHALLGKPITLETAEMAGLEATAGAMPFSHNEYKIQLAQVAVKRAILRAAGIDTGGLDSPMTNESNLPARESHLV